MTDSADIPPSTLASSNANQAPINPTQPFVFPSAFPQSFPFTRGMTNYMFNAWSVIAYEKLIQTCKYFYSTYRIYIIDMCDMVTPDSMDIGYYFNEDQKFFFKNWKGTEMHHYEINLSAGLKLWVTKTLACSFASNPQIDPLLARNMLNHIYRCDATEVSLTHQYLTPEELYFVIKAAKFLKLHANVISNSDGSRVSYRDVLSHTPSIKSFVCDKDQFTGDITAPDGTQLVLKDLNELMINVNTLADLNNYEAWCQFIKLNNRTEKAVPDFHFKQEVHDEEVNLEDVKKAVLKTFPDADVSNHVTTSWNNRNLARGLVISYKRCTF